MKFGEHLRKVRLEKNLSAGKLSKLSGVSQPYISQVENGTRIPSLRIIKKLSEALKGNYYDLIAKTEHCLVYPKSDLLFYLHANKELTLYDKLLDEKDKMRIENMLHLLFDK